MVISMIYYMWIDLCDLHSLLFINCHVLFLFKMTENNESNGFNQAGDEADNPLTILQKI